MNILNRVILSSLMLMLSASLDINADQVKPISVMMNPLAFQSLEQSRESIDADMQSCESDNIAAITIYSITDKAQIGIDVKVDGNPIGSLTTHFPDTGPECKTPSSDGIITIIIPASPAPVGKRPKYCGWPIACHRLITVRDVLTKSMISIIRWGRFTGSMIKILPGSSIRLPIKV